MQALNLTKNQTNECILLNFEYFIFRIIDKQARSGRDTDEIVDAMNNDSTTCCRNKQTRSREAVKQQQKKRARETSEGSSGETSSTRSGTSDRSKKKPLPKKQKTKVAKTTQLTDIAKPPSAKKPSPAPQNIETMPDLSAFCSAELGDDAPAAMDENAGATDLFEFLSNRSVSMAGAELEPDVPAAAAVPPLTVPPTASPAPIVIQNVLSGNAAQQNINSMGSPSMQNTSPSCRMTTARPQTVTRVSSNTIRVNASPTTEPVYHVINGYRIDLNSASQQNTIRLPNGKIIHVKKQPVLPNGQPARHPSRMARPNTPQARPGPNQPQGRPAPIPQQMQRPPPPLARQQITGVRQQVPVQSRANSRVRPTVQIPSSASAILQSMSNHLHQPRSAQAIHQHQQQQQQQMQQQQQQLHQQMMQASAAQNQAQQQLHPSVIAQQAKDSIVAAGPRRYQGGTVGIARTQFERQIFNGLEICTHIENKLKTLMNSNAYKNVRNVNDIKELQIHMSYLLTFTQGRFKTLEEKCLDDMRKLGFASEADSLAEGNVIKKYGSDNDEDDIEIVEPQHTTINVDDSDDEQQPKKTPDKSGGQRKRPVPVTPPSHLASAIAAAQSLSMQIDKAAQPRAPLPRRERIPTVPRVERVTPVDRVERTPPAARPERTSPAARPPQSESPADILERTADAPEDTEDIECEADIMALLQPQVILNDHDELELPMPPPLSPTPIANSLFDGIPDDPKLRGRAQVRLKKADEEFPELMNMLGKVSRVADKPSNTAEDEPAASATDAVTENGKSKDSAIEIGESEDESAEKSIEMADEVVADYEDAIHRLQELSSEICASPTSITNANAQADRTEADNTIDEFVSVLETSGTSSKTAKTKETSSRNVPMDTEDIMRILEMPEIIAAVDEASAKTNESSAKVTDHANEATNIDETIPEFRDCVNSTVAGEEENVEESVVEIEDSTLATEGEINETTVLEPSNEVEINATNSVSGESQNSEIDSNAGDVELPEDENMEEAEDAEHENDADDNVEAEQDDENEDAEHDDDNDDESMNDPLATENDELSADVQTTKEVNSAIASTRARDTTLNDTNGMEEDSFENISSPDTFDDYAKNGVASKNNDTNIFDDVIDELIIGNISAIAN